MLAVGLAKYQGIMGGLPCVCVHVRCRQCGEEWMDTYTLADRAITKLGKEMN